MKKVILIMVLILLSFSLVMAEDVTDHEDVKETLTGMDEETTFLDNPLIASEVAKVVGQEVPSYLQFVGDDDVINVYDGDGDFLLGTKLDDRVIVEFLEYEEESDLNVYVDFMTALAIYNSEDPLGDFMVAKDDGLIVFEAKNFKDKIKLKVGLVALGVYGWFA